MQYLRSVSGSVSKTWNSINPATLSGAIDVIVVEHEDGTLSCSPFHVRFGKFSLLRPHEKKVEFKVNDVKREFPMKLGEGGEAFFVFETTTSVPAAMQTSPLISPATSPEMRPSTPSLPPLSDAENLELPVTDEDVGGPSARPMQEVGPGESVGAKAIPRGRTQSEFGASGLSSSLGEQTQHFGQLEARSAAPGNLHRANTDHALPSDKMALDQSFDASQSLSKSVERPVSPFSMDTRSPSPPPTSSEEARTRAINLSKKLWTSNIPAHVTDQGDLMLDMTGYKSSEEEALRAEVIARRILSEELEGNYDIGSLIGADEKGNLWIYSSEEAKEQANKRLMSSSLHELARVGYGPSTDAISDPGYHSDDARSESSVELAKTVQHFRHDSDSAVGMSPPTYSTEPDSSEATKAFAKTLRLTSDQLKDLELSPGQNSMSFTVNRATCTASLWLWRYDVPIIISDIDGTITKSDALGHVLNMIGRDWTHLGVAKLYTEIAANGYNFLYLTSRSVGQADTTRAYLSGVIQEGGYKLPKGPVIMSPDRTMAALRREVYLRKPEVFKMACLRDIMALFHGTSGSRAMFVDPGEPEAGAQSNTAKTGSPFYAGFGNRLTDAISYRSVNIPSTRIFTINTSSEVSLDLSTLSNYRTGYSTMREVVDQYFPPVGLLVKGGGEDFTDFNYWRDRPLEIEDFSASESEDEDDLEMEEEDMEDEDEEDDDDDENRYLPPQTPLYTPGILSEDEYATMTSSAYSASGRPSLDISRAQSAAPSVYGNDDLTPISGPSEEERARQMRLRRLQRDLTMTPNSPVVGSAEEEEEDDRERESVGEDEGDIDEDEDDDDLTAALELDARQRQGSLTLSRTLSIPTRQKEADAGRS